MAYERRHAPLLSRRAFFWRLLRHVGLAGGLIIISLAIGILGYHHFMKISWVDAILNASMILTGMGPVNPAITTGAKLFASAYALFSGVAFLTTVAILFTPVVHRFLHRFHLDFDEDDSPPKSKPKCPDGMKRVR